MNYTEDLHSAVEVLLSGGIIAYPTDTVWGIGCDATNNMAVRKIFDIKKRSDAKAMLTLVSDEDMLDTYVEGGIPASCKDYIHNSDRPVTVVYPKGCNVAPSLLSTDGSIGIRIVRDGFAHDLCRMLGRPIVSTSANISGQPSPAVFGEIDDSLLDAMDYVSFTGRENDAPGRPSRVVKIEEDGNIIILRD